MSLWVDALLHLAARLLYHIAVRNRGTHMGWWSKLFGSKPQAQSEQLSLVDVQDRALLRIIIPQLQLLGFEMGRVPADGSFVSKRSRGYIYGTAASVLCQLTRQQNREMIHEIMQSAFTLVWGPERANELFEMTLHECAARDGETLAGSYAAEADVGEVYSGQPYAAVTGFWLLNNGLNHPETMMPAIENPRPLPPVD